MKFKSIAVLSVTLASIAMFSTACQSPNSQAKDNSVSQQNQSAETADNNSPRSGSDGYRQGGGLPPNLKLTDEQKTKLKTIQENYRSKMDNILTDEQKKELKAARDRGQGRKAMQSLNLTDAQKQQMKTLRQSQRQEIESILTPEQKQQLQGMGHKGQHKHKSEDAPASEGQ